jgi:hypothetical protein
MYDRSGGKGFDISNNNRKETRAKESPPINSNEHERQQAESRKQILKKLADLDELRAILQHGLNDMAGWVNHPYTVVRCAADHLDKQPDDLVAAAAFESAVGEAMRRAYYIGECLHIFPPLAALLADENNAKAGHTYRG